jgi:hypothetical protein
MPEGQSRPQRSTGAPAQSSFHTAVREAIDERTWGSFVRTAASRQAALARRLHLSFFEMPELFSSSSDKDVGFRPALALRARFARHSAR